MKLFTYLCDIMVQNVILCEFAKNDSMLVKVRDH